MSYLRDYLIEQHTVDGFVQINDSNEELENFMSVLEQEKHIDWYTLNEQIMESDDIRQYVKAMLHRNQKEQFEARTAIDRLVLANAKEMLQIHLSTLEI